MKLRTILALLSSLVLTACATDMPRTTSAPPDSPATQADARTAESDRQKRQRFLISSQALPPRNVNIRDR